MADKHKPQSNGAPQPSSEDPAAAADRAGEPASGGGPGTEPTTGKAQYPAVAGTQSSVPVDGRRGSNDPLGAPAPHPEAQSPGSSGNHAVAISGIGGFVSTTSGGSPRAASGYPQVHDTADPAPGSDRTPERIVGKFGPGAAREAGYIAEGDPPEMPQHGSGRGLTQGELQRSSTDDEGNTDGTEKT